MTLGFGGARVGGAMLFARLAGMGGAVDARDEARVRLRAGTEELVRERAGELLSCSSPSWSLSSPPSRSETLSMWPLSS